MARRGWKPWQVHPFLLIPMLLLSLILAGLLFSFVHRSEDTMPSSLFRDMWLAWYLDASNASTAEARFSFPTGFDIDVSADCKRGLLDLDTSSSLVYFTWNFLPPFWLVHWLYFGVSSTQKSSASNHSTKPHNLVTHPPAPACLLSTSRFRLFYPPFKHSGDVTG